MSKIETVKDIVDWRLCLGCGACAYICPQHIKLADQFDIGIRPEITKSTDCHECHECLDVCPSYSVDFGLLKNRSDYHSSVDEKTERNWGAITGIWEGYATRAHLEAL